MTDRVYSLAIKPGIQRDGTQFDSPMYVDGLWVRFQRGRPRKIAGYKGIFLNGNGISRGMVQQSSNGLNYVYSGYSSGLEYWQTDNDDGIGSGPTLISLPSSFVSSPDNLWSFDLAYDPYGSGALSIFAHAGQNLSHIDSTTNTPVFSGAFPGGAMSKVGVFTINNASLTSGSTTVTLPVVTYLVGVGQTVSSPTGIQSGTTVTAITYSSTTTTLTISLPATLTETANLTFDNNIAVSGGLVMLYPYLFVYGNNGLIQNSAAGDFTNWVSADSNATNVSSTKVVKGMAIRGGTTSPAGLFWSLDTLTRVTYSPQTIGASTGTATIYWRYDTISTQTSILSPNSVIEYDGIFYWCGVDRFLAYNGVVQEIPNNTNINFFFDNLNYAQRSKVWASKVPRWGEIWWFYPSGDSTECNNAIIYNVRDNVWYDAGFALGARRSAGTFSEVFRYPIWAGWEQNNQGYYTIWQHESGTDQIYLNNVDAIQSYFETNSIGWVTGSPMGGPGIRTVINQNKQMRLIRVEPDFVQNGSMNLYVLGKSYADDVDVVSQPYVFEPNTIKIDLREQRREMRLRFESNTQNGYYETGNILFLADLGDERGDGNP